MAGRDVLMRIGVLFFGVLKDIMGRSAETVELREGARVQDVLSLYTRKTPKLEPLLSSLAISVNQEYSEAGRALRDGDEVGLLPPVSGGSAADGRLPDETSGEVRIIREAIDGLAVVARLKRPEDGAAVVFDGVVRNNTRGRQHALSRL